MYNFKTTPMKHQSHAFELSKDALYFAYFAEMGTGKSKMAIDDIASKCQEGLINAVMITTFKGIYKNWIGELAKHWPDEIKYNVLVYSQGKVDGYIDPNKVNIFLFNIEALQQADKSKCHNLCLSFIKRFNHGQSVALIIDESTAVKNPKSNRTKNLLEIARKCKYRRILTGSAISNSPLDLYYQFLFLNKQVLGYPTYFKFKQALCIMRVQEAGLHQFKQIIGYDEFLLEEVRKWVQDNAYIISKAECLDLPPKVYSEYHCDMNQEQRKAYKQMRDELVYEFKNKEHELDVMYVESAMSKLMKLQQITCGFIHTEEGVQMLGSNNSKIDAIIEIAESATGKVIIWCNFRTGIEQITLALKKEFGAAAAESYYGETTQAERERIIEDFQDPDSELKFFVGNPATAGYGLTLTQATTVIYFSNGYSLEHREQSEDRAHRHGQNKSVCIIDLISTGTVNSKIVAALKDKKKLKQYVLSKGTDALIDLVT